MIESQQRSRIEYSRRSRDESEGTYLWEGASGETYEFRTRPKSDEDELTAMHGVYMFARYHADTDRCDAVYIGITATGDDGLWGRVRNHEKRDDINRHGGYTHIHIFVPRYPYTRTHLEKIERDLIEALNPPCNHP